MDLPVYEVSFGSKDDQQSYGANTRKEKYLNKRAAIYGALREWLKHGCIPEEIPMIENSLPTEMSVPTFTYSKEDVIQLESKKDIKRRGEASPDATDALACTLAFSWLDELPNFTQNGEADHYSEPSPYDERNFDYA